jgi:outer membrane receptor for ferrienterochelin and colicin
MKKLLLSIILAFFVFQTIYAQNKVTISGYIREKGSKELLIGVNVYLPNSAIGTSSNTYGFYSLTLPKTDSITLTYSFVGFSKKTIRIPFTANKALDIDLESENTLDEVVVRGRAETERVSDTPQMSTIEIPISQIKKIPTLMGEKDVLKVLQLMPGVQKGSEGQSGIYVRGGGPDQNLIILDDAPVYNASHLFGFFSTFNGDALKSVELVKGGFPARYGGRLSSVIDMNMKDGNRQKFSGEGGIGLISSRLVLEGPIRLNKKKASRSSFIISGRRTYLDLLAKPFIKKQNKDATIKEDAGYFFYDLNAKFNFEVNAKNKLYLSGYFGRDKFNVNAKGEAFNSANGINWGNATGTFRWNHQYSQKLFSNTSIIFSDYKFRIFGNQSGINTTDGSLLKFNLSYLSGIQDKTFKHDVDFYPNPKHAIRVGASVIAHEFTPDATIIQESTNNVNISNITKFNSTESGVYIEDTYQPFPNLKLNAGLRISSYAIKSVVGLRPEPRLSVAFKPNANFAIKGSYAKMNQYLHLLSNTGLGLPTDLWVPSTDKIAPQTSEQWAAGIAQDLPGKTGLTLTLEGYYKKMNNLLNYKEGSSFLQLGGNPNIQNQTNWEDKVTAGNGTSYGAEVLLQKKQGRLSGWIGYTWSKTEWQFDELNFGKKFFPKYDRRHDASIVAIYELNKKITLSGTWVYGTGNALTVPFSEYLAYSSNTNKNRDLFGTWGFTVNEYGNKNSFRAEAYHRLDLGVQFHKVKKRHERTWDISIYNAYSRKNPYFYSVGNNAETSFFNPRGFQNYTPNGKLVLKRYSLFPIIPSITYNFKF